MARPVSYEVSNLGLFKPSSGGPNTGGQIATVVGQHVIVQVGGYLYQSGATPPDLEHTVERFIDVLDKNGDKFKAAKEVLDDFRFDSSQSTAPINWGNVRVGTGGNLGFYHSGETTKTDAEIMEWVAEWNLDRGKAEYDPQIASCHTFAVNLLHWLCRGSCKMPPCFGSHRIDYPGVEENGGPLKVGGLGGMLAVGNEHAHGKFGQSIEAGSSGAFVDQGATVGVGAPTRLGRVGVHAGLQADTGLGIRDGCAEANLLGFGVKAGKNGVGIKTPVAGVECTVM